MALLVFLCGNACFVILGIRSSYIRLTYYSHACLHCFVNWTISLILYFCRISLLGISYYYEYSQCSRFNISQFLLYFSCIWKCVISQCKELSNSIFIYFCLLLNVNICLFHSIIPFEGAYIFCGGRGCLKLKMPS